MKKFIKTDADKRETYTYLDVNGQKLVTLVAGENGVSQEDIKKLHLLDDEEIRNNLKNSKPKVEEWQKEGLELWQMAHPHEKIPKNWALSLDNPELSDESKSAIHAKMAVSPEFEELPEIGRLHEAIELLELQQQALIQAVYFEGKTITEIARAEGVYVSSVHKRLKRIYKQIQKNF